jgi:hypothetical protein
LKPQLLSSIPRDISFDISSVRISQLLDLTVYNA